MNYDATLTFTEYEEKVIKLAQYPLVGSNMVYPAMGLAGEAGEYVDKVKKRWRNLNTMSDGNMAEEDRKEFAKELGDVLWYIAACSMEIGMNLTTIAHINIEKLLDRHERGVIKSTGDSR